MLLCLAISCAVAIAGCGDDESDAVAVDRLRIVTSDPSPDKVVMRADSEVDAGTVRIAFRNAGDTPHDVQLFRVDGDRGRGDLIGGVIEALDSATRPGWVHPEGGVAAVPAGGTAVVTQVLQAGTYYLADTQERERGGARVTNAVMGGFERLEVTGDDDGRLPSSPARIAISDGRFRTSGIRPGRNRVTVVNRGEEWHQVVAFAVPRGMSFGSAQRRLAVREQQTGWMPVDVPHARATAVLEGGGAQVTHLTLARGRYLLTCFVGDRAGGPPHLQEGEVSRLTVR